MRDFIWIFVTTEHPPPRQDTHRHSTAGMESGCKLGNTAGPGRDAELGCSSTDTGHTVQPPTLQLTTLSAETQAKQGADRK